MPGLVDSVRSRLTKARPLPAGLYHYQAPPDAALPYRMHLRLEPDGRGLLVVNAATVLHLNNSAAEYAYYLVQGLSPDAAAKAMSKRYRVSRARARQDFVDLTDRIRTLVSSQDLDPEIYLDFGRQDPYTAQLSAPYRLDCALTYCLPEGATTQSTPAQRVKEELTTGQWQAVMDKAWAAGVPHIVFTGGEPTLRDDLPGLIAHTEQVGQVVGVLTDGRRLADPAYLQTLLQSGLDHLMLVLDPGNDAAWQGLQNSVGADLFTTVHLTLRADEAGPTAALLERLKGLNVRSVSLSADTPERRDALKAAADQASHLGLALVWDLPVPYSALNPVTVEIEAATPGAGRAWLYVEPDGDVLPAQGQNRVLGNLVSDAWETIWQAAQADARQQSA
jgi:hypothetical protein